MGDSSLESQVELTEIVQVLFADENFSKMPFSFGNAPATPKVFGAAFEKAVGGVMAASNSGTTEHSFKPLELGDSELANKKLRFMHYTMMPHVNEAYSAAELRLYDYLNGRKQPFGKESKGYTRNYIHPIATTKLIANTLVEQDARSSSTEDLIRDANIPDFAFATIPESPRSRLPSTAADYQAQNRKSNDPMTKTTAPASKARNYDVLSDDGKFSNTGSFSDNDSRSSRSETSRSNASSRSDSRRLKREINMLRDDLDMETDAKEKYREQYHSKRKESKQAIQEASENKYKYQVMKSMYSDERKSRKHDRLVHQAEMEIMKTALRNAQQVQCVANPLMFPGFQTSATAIPTSSGQPSTQLSDFDSDDSLDVTNVIGQPISSSKRRKLIKRK